MTVPRTNASDIPPTNATTTITSTTSTQSKESITPTVNSSGKKAKANNDISDRPEKRLRIDETSLDNLDIDTCWSNSGTTTTENTSGTSSDHSRLVKFLDNVSQLHVQTVQTVYPEQTFIENGIKSLYSLFLPSCRQYIADDAKIDQLTSNPKNEENRKKETAASTQIDKYKEELHQWDNLSKLHALIRPPMDSNHEEDENEMDEDTLKRYGLAKQLDTTITSAISSAVGKVDMITEAVRGTKRQLRATQKGTAVVSLQTRQLAFPDVPTDAKQTLKALMKTKPTTPSTTSKSSSSSSLTTTSGKKEKNTTDNTLGSPIPNVLRRITQTNATPSSIKRR